MPINDAYDKSFRLEERQGILALFEMWLSSPAHYDRGR
jgi:hypothetical protein